MSNTVNFAALGQVGTWCLQPLYVRITSRQHIDDLAGQAETAAGQGNLRDLYLVTKKLTGKFQQTGKPVKDKNGNPLTTT